MELKESNRTFAYTGDEPEPFTIGIGHPTYCFMGLAALLLFLLTREKAFHSYSYNARERSEAGWLGLY